ncbi:MAG: hypothetical protein ABWK01_07860, partial [Infirmifilum sp.]
GQYLVAKGLNRAVLEASALGSLVQLAALYPLVLALRSQGVALAIVASQAASLIYMAFRTGVWARSTGPLLPGLVAVVPALIPLGVVGNTILKVALGFLVYGASYLAVAFHTGVLTSDDVELLLKALKLHEIERGFWIFHK